MNDILKRITALEIALSRLQSAMGGIQSAIENAQKGAASCGKCGEFIPVDGGCETEGCPCGLYEG